MTKSETKKTDEQDKFVKHSYSTWNQFGTMYAYLQWSQSGTMCVYVHMCSTQRYKAAQCSVVSAWFSKQMRARHDLWFWSV